MRSLALMMLTRVGLLIAAAKEPRKARNEIAATMHEIIRALGSRPT